LSSTQDDVQQLVAAAHFLRDQPKAEAHYYSRVIAEVAQRMLAASAAPAEARCESCVGNDADMPCAYPGEDKPGCLRDARLRVDRPTPPSRAAFISELESTAQNLLLDEDAVGAERVRHAVHLLRSAPPGTWKVLLSSSAVITKIDAAIAMVSALCDGSQRWTMSVPARPDSDPDLVIAGALQAARDLIGGSK
jgi:hypothetical protein